MSLICLNGCFSVSESMSVTYIQTDRQTELLLEVLSDLQSFVAVMVKQSKSRFRAVLEHSLSILSAFLAF